VLCDSVAIRFDALPPVQRPQHRQDRPEAQKGVEDDQRHAHADAEAEQRCPRRLACERVEQECLLGADPRGADREQDGEALGHLDEDRVVQRRGHVEGAQEEEDRRQPQGPVGRLPDRDAAQVARPVREDSEPQTHALPEADQLLREPEEQQEQDQQNHADHDQSSADVSEEPVEVERAQVREHGAAGERSGGEGVDDEAESDNRVEQCQRNERRGEGRIRRALDTALDDEEPDRVAAAGGNDRVDAHAREDRAPDRAPAHDRVRVRRRDDVPPRAADAADLDELAEEGDRERRPADVGQMVEEDADVVEDRAHCRSYSCSLRGFLLARF